MSLKNENLWFVMSKKWASIEAEVSNPSLPSRNEDTIFL
jgi:hypothetical protein